MKKYCLDLRVTHAEHLNGKYVLLKLTVNDGGRLPAMLPGQFVQVRIDHEPTTFLRRPISIHFVDRELNELWLLVAAVGNGTRRLARLTVGDVLNCILPLGHGFSDSSLVKETGGTPHRYLLVGGGVGVAPLLFQGQMLAAQGADVTFLLGARTASDLLMIEEYKRYGRVCLTTEDGSAGERGFVTQHSLLQQTRFDMVQCCGPVPMMKAVARYARAVGTECEVSLENMMACGVGACLCCVEKTTEGNLCVCKEGPVFNTNRLLWEGVEELNS